MQEDVHHWEGSKSWDVGFEGVGPCKRKCDTEVRLGELIASPTSCPD